MTEAKCPLSSARAAAFDYTRYQHTTDDTLGSEHTSQESLTRHHSWVSCLFGLGTCFLAAATVPAQSPLACAVGMVFGTPSTLDLVVVACRPYASHPARDPGACPHSCHAPSLYPCHPAYLPQNSHLHAPSSFDSCHRPSSPHPGHHIRPVRFVSLRVLYPGSAEARATGRAFCLRRKSACLASLAVRAPGAKDE